MNSPLARVTALALSALATGVASGVIVLAYRLARLPPTDLAYGMPVWVFLRDPFVLMVFIPLTVAVAFIGFLASVLTLWYADLRKALPFVSSVAIGVITVTTHLRIARGAQLAVAAAILAMLWCRFGSGWVPPASSHSPGSRVGHEGRGQGHERDSW